MGSQKCKIIVIDKKNNYSFLFEGLRKNKFKILKSDTILNYTPNDIECSNNLFFMVLYELSDVFELLKLNTQTVPYIIASKNPKIIKKLKILGFTQLIDLSGGVNIMASLNECLKKILYK